MSEVQSRPARGRSSARGGRGGHGARGPRSNKQTNGDHAESSVDTSAEQGELGELKKRYASQLITLKELFPGWNDVELLLAIEESDGDLSTTVEKISEGNVSQFAEVKKTKDRARSKVKETSAPADGTSTIRGSGRGRGTESVRGRGRGTDRGRGGIRGSRGAATTTHGTRTSGAPSVPTVESSAYDTPAAAGGVQEHHQPKSAERATSEPEAPKSTASAAPAKKTWASMFAPVIPKSIAPKLAAKLAAPAEENSSTSEKSAPKAGQEPVSQAEKLPEIPPVADEIVEEVQHAVEEVTSTPEQLDEPTAPELDLTPSKDELTKDNIEHLPDDSHPPPTETAASTVASSKDIGTLASVATPLSSSGQAPIGRPAIGGYQTTALKATQGAHRSASFQRKLVEQQEAVVMPGNHAVNQAAVQFGSLGLGGEGDADSLDVDEDREEAETRTQPPQHSPVAQPRASLPPVPRQAPSTESQPQEIPTPKQAPGLPPPPQQQQPLSQQSPSNPLASHAMQNQGSQSQSYNQFGRYGQGVSGQSDATAQSQKSFDPFGQQAPQANQHEYAYQQQHGHQQSHQQPHIGGFSSAPDAFASQYSLSEQQRSAYNQNYYNQYNQQGTPSQQEAGSAQQRASSGFGAGPNDATFAQGQQPQAQGRYTDSQNSGHNTPNPSLSGQHPAGPASQQGQQGQHMHQPHAQQSQHGNYPYNHPYYGTPYYANYMQQYGYGGQGGGYGSFSKGMYQPHHYQMSPQTSYDQHSSSPANTGGFGASSMHGRDSALGGGLGEYGRSVSSASQTPQQNQHNATAGGFGGAGLPDVFSRPGYGGQNSYSHQQTGQQGGNDDSLKQFSDSKSSWSTPSALGAQPGRPGSATNNTTGQSGQGGLPQQQQQGFGGYPSHLQGGQNSQYGSLGGLGHQGGNSHQQSGYGGGYGGFGGGYGGNNYSRGGWGTNYGQH